MTAARRLAAIRRRRRLKGEDEADAAKAQFL
jgi:hypothetical protein